jgi:transposase
LDLRLVEDVLTGAYHRVGPGRPPFNPLSLLRFKVILVLKGYRSQRALEREVRVDSRVGRLCGFDESIPSHSTIVRFERRVGFERLKKLVGHVVEDLVSRGFIKGLKVVLDSKPLKLDVEDIQRIRRGDGLTGKPGSAGA